MELSACSDKKKWFYIGFYNIVHYQKRRVPGLPKSFCFKTLHVYKASSLLEHSETMVRRTRERVSYFGELLAHFGVPGLETIVFCCKIVHSPTIFRECIFIQIDASCNTMFLNVNPSSVQFYWFLVVGPSAFQKAKERYFEIFVKQ